MSKEIKHENPLKDKYADTSGDPVTVDVLKTSFPNAELIGTVQKSGVVAVEKSQHGSWVSAAVRHPKLILNGDGGMQRNNIIEYSLLRPVGIEIASRVARERLSLKNPFPSIGIELEGWRHSKKSGELIPSADPKKQIELQAGLLEEPMEDPVHSLQDLAMTRAQMTLDRAKAAEEEGILVLDTSVPLSLGGKKAGESAGLQVSDNTYVKAMNKIFAKIYVVPQDTQDSRVRQALQAHACVNGFSGIDEMISELDLGPVWDVAASHVSLGTPPQTEIAIAIANIFSSDLATAAEFLTHGTPLHNGNLVKVEEEGKGTVTVKDVRALNRYLFKSAQVTNPFISEPDEYADRVTEGIVNGWATTADRSAFYYESPDGERASAAHARARLRGYGKKGSERIEFVGGGSSPSMYDMLARDAYLTILWTAALEAVADKKSPQEYFAEKGFASAAEWKNQMELGISHALHGAEDEKVNALISQNLRFMEYMYEKYPHLQDYIKFVQMRLRNLREKPDAKTVDEYTHNPKGNIADVIIRMKEDGASDVEILTQLNNHQLAVSQIIKDNKGDYGKLLEKIS